MKQIAVISIFPEVIEAYLGASIIGKARERGLVSFDVRDLRDYTDDRHRTVDDSPFGGGPGMVMKPEPIAQAIEAVLSDGTPTRTVLVTPQGRPMSQSLAEEFAGEQKRLLFLCGRYEGIDERVVERYVDDEVSLGDYVLSGGELAALVIIDASVRLLEGVVGDGGSLTEESFSWGILDYPHYTRPQLWRGMVVPEALLTGNHREIARFRRKEALRRTLRRRPDLLESVRLDDDDKKLIEQIKEEEGWTS